MIEDPRLTVETMERAAQQYVSEKRQNHILKSIPSQYHQDIYQHDPHHQQPHYQRHHHHSQSHGPQYAIQVRETANIQL